MQQIPHHTIAHAVSTSLHDMAQPLTVLLGTVELAMARSAEDSAQHRVLAQVLEHLRTLAEGMKQTRDIVRLHHPPSDISTFSAFAVLQRMAQNFAKNVEAKGAQFIWDVPEHGSDMLTTSEGRVCQAMKLVLSNLLPFLKSGDRIRLSAESGPEGISLGAKVESDPARATEVGGASSVQKFKNWEFVEAIAESIGGKFILGGAPLSAVVLLPKPSFGLHEGQAENSFAASGSQ